MRFISMNETFVFTFISCNYRGPPPGSQQDVNSPFKRVRTQSPTSVQRSPGYHYSQEHQPHSGYPVAATAGYYQHYGQVSPFLKQDQ